MIHLFTIPIYEKDNEGKFQKIDETVYEITYLNNKVLELDIVVNGFLTKQKINFNKAGYKKVLLKAISEYVLRDKDKKYNLVKNYITLEDLSKIYQARYIQHIKNKLLTLTGENSRDIIIKYYLIKNLEQMENLDKKEMFFKGRSTAYLLKIYRKSTYYRDCETCYSNIECNTCPKITKQIDISVFDKQTEQEITFTLGELKKELDSRPHIMNKQESKEFRKQKIKQGK